jgi:nucleotide-binding universal stress UspA family protein
VPIIVPIDFSDEDRDALDVAIELADLSENVCAVHFRPPLTVYEPAAVFNLPRKDAYQTTHTAFRIRCSDPRYQNVQFKVLFCEPIEEILEYAVRIQTGLIVISMRPASILQHFLLRSIPERMLRRATCPVLVLQA